MKDLKKRLGALVLAGLTTLSLVACSVPLGDAEVRTGEDGTVVIDGEAIWDETAPDGDAASPETTDPAEDAAPAEETEPPAEDPTADAAEDAEPLYEYYSTLEELLADIQEGYVFRLDHTFDQAARPTVTGGHWPFQVSDEGTLDLEIRFSDLLPLEDEGLVSGESRVEVRLTSPEGETVYGYAATGAELEEDIAIQETIPLTPGEWDLEISFVFRSAGGDSPAALHISAQCQSLTQEDLTYLKELRLR